MLKQHTPYRGYFFKRFLSKSYFLKDLAQVYMTAEKKQHKIVYFYNDSI